MGYRDDSKTSRNFWDGRLARERGEPITACPFKTKGVRRKAWELGWKEADDRLAPRQVTEKEWHRRIKREFVRTANSFVPQGLPNDQHFCTHWEAAQCVCFGWCGCHFQGSIRNERASLIRLDHIRSYTHLRDDYIVMVHGRLPFDVTDHFHCAACAAKSDEAFGEGEILSIEEVRAAVADGRKCFDEFDYRRWRHLFHFGTSVGRREAR